MPFGCMTGGPAACWAHLSYTQSQVQQVNEAASPSVPVQYSHLTGPLVEAKQEKFDVYWFIGPLCILRQVLTFDLTNKMLMHVKKCCAKQSQVIECIRTPRLLLGDFFVRGKKQGTRWVVNAPRLKVLGLFGFRNVTNAPVRREYNSSL